VVGQGGSGGTRVSAVSSRAKDSVLTLDPLSPLVSLRFVTMGLVQYGAPIQESIIKTVAICAGSGGSMFKDVKADLYWTGEMGHVSPGVRPFLLKSDGRICRQTQRRSGY
jgi:putative NIF3 family GTP cyclohydrolase 1 type 2